MTIIGFEWNQTDDNVNHLIVINNKTLILHDGEYKKYTTSGFITISSTLPTSQQFMSDGMDSLSPLLDSKVGMPVPIALTEVNDDMVINQGGKVFNTKLNLNKYSDIKKYYIEVLD